MTRPTFKTLARSVRKYLKQAERKARWDYIEAGKLMLEAKNKMDHDAFVQWTKQFDSVQSITWSLRIRRQKTTERAQKKYKRGGPIGCPHQDRQQQTKL